MKFNVNVSEKDYLDLNIFLMTKTKRGKNQMLLYRISISMLILGIALIQLTYAGISLSAFLGIIPHAILLVIFQILIKPFSIWCMKGNVKSLEKRGNRLYTKEFEIGFYDDYFVEVTSDAKNEVKYSAIQSVSIVKDKAIYIHLNDLLSSLIPISCLESKEQYEELLKLLREKCSVVNEF